MSRTVTRKYYQKKTGLWITKTYTYAHPSTKGLTLVNKRGKVNTKNVERLKKTIQDNDSFKEEYKRKLLKDLEATIAQRAKDKHKLTSTGFFGKQESDSIARFFINAGYSAEEFADEYDLDVEDVLNEENWSSGDLLLGGRIFRFNWTYTGNFVEVL